MKICRSTIIIHKVVVYAHMAYYMHAHGVHRRLCQIIQHNNLNFRKKKYDNNLRNKFPYCIQCCFVIYFKRFGSFLDLLFPVNSFVIDYDDLLQQHLIECVYTVVWLNFSVEGTFIEEQKGKVTPKRKWCPCPSFEIPPLLRPYDLQCKHCKKIAIGLRLRQIWEIPIHQNQSSEKP